jgi:GTP cyclohydrolase I
VDLAKMEAGIRLFLEGIGERFDGDDLERTPERVARAWGEDLVGGYAIDAAAALSWTAARTEVGPVVVRDLRFTSVCVHHLLPFFGSAQIAYLPAERLAGLSKLGRVVDAHARRLQTQERLTEAVVATLTRALEPQGVMALLCAKHTCMSCRGVRQERGRMVTVAWSGLFAQDAGARREMLDLLRDGVGVGEPRG